MKNYFLKLSIVLFALVIVGGCGDTRSKISNLVDQADSLKSQVKEITDDINLDSLATITDGLMDSGNSADVEDSGDEESIVNGYHADELWEKAITQFENGKGLKPTKAVQEEIIETNKDEVSDVGGAQIFGDIYFTELDSFVLWPTKIINNGEEQDMSEFPAKPTEKQLKGADKFEPLYKENYNIINVFMKDWQDKIYLEATTENLIINEIECQKYAFSLPKPDGKYYNGFAFINKETGAPVKVIYTSKNNSASGGIYYIFKSIDENKVAIEIMSYNLAVDMKGLGGFNRITKITFMEYDN